MDVLRLFQYAEKLKFSEIEKALNVRSNKLTYHLKKLTRKGVLIRDGSYYKLSESSEHLIPYLTKKASPLPVVLILVGNSKRAFLYKRKKRPFRDLLSLPGGRVLVGESIEKASERIMLEDFKFKVNFKKINSISLEYVKKSEKLLHSFVLFFVTVESEEPMELTNISKNKEDIISSDYVLITNDSKKETEVSSLVTLV